MGSHAQERADAQPQSTLYIYRLRMLEASKRRMTLSLDGKRFAYLQNGRYWAVTLPPGEHVLADKSPKNYIKATLTAGKTQYIRAEFVQNGLGFNARFSIVDPETAAGDLRRLKIGDADQIQNTALAFIKP